MVELLIVFLLSVALALLTSRWIHREQSRADSRRPRPVLIFIAVLSAALVALIIYSLAR